MKARSKLLATILICASAPVIATNFGALAYNRKSDAWGASYNHPSQAAANRGALSACGAKCAVVVEFYNNCAAYAVGTRDSYGFAHHVDRRAAQRWAMDECGKHGTQCQILMTACNSAPDSGYSTPYQPPERRPSNSCWYKNGARVPQCID
jgi:hypothetical protein